MSNKNRTYSVKVVFKSIIEQVFESIYDQLPLGDVDYPFAVVEFFFVDDCPNFKLRLTIDLWDNNLNQIEFQHKIDDLINVLDFMSYVDGSVCIAGEIESNGDITTQEEDLIRYQIVGNYDISKVG